MIVRECTAGDLPRVSWLKREAFRAPLDDEHWTERGRVVVVDGTVQAAVRAGASAQFYGGRRVPITALDTLMVAPEARGTGVGTELMVTLLRESQQRGVPMVTNYATTIPFYRRLGWEIAGCRTLYCAPPGHPPRADRLQLRAWGPDDLPAVAECYRGFAERSSGLVARSEAWWREWVVDESASQPLYRYLVGADDRVTGYVIYTQSPRPSTLGAFSLECRELLWTDRPSLDALLAFLWGQGPLVEELSWPGPPDEPLLTRFEQSRIKVAWPYTWLVRITNPIAAFEARGHPPDVETGFALAVVDPVLADVVRSFQVDVAGGRAHAEEVSRASMRVDAGALGAIYTGWLAPRDAVRLGRLEGATARDLESLEAAFAGPRPWMIETY